MGWEKLPSAEADAAASLMLGIENGIFFFNDSGRFVQDESKLSNYIITRESTDRKYRADL